MNFLEKSYTLKLTLVIYALFYTILQFLKKIVKIFDTIPFNDTSTSKLNRVINSKLYQ